MNRHSDRFTHIVAAHHLETEIMEHILENVGIIVNRLFLEQLLAQTAFHIERIGDLTAFHMDTEGNIRALPGFNGILLKRYRKRQRFFILLAIVEDALGGLNGKSGQKNGKQNKNQ